MICDTNNMVAPYVIVKYETRVRDPKFYYFTGKMDSKIKGIMEDVAKHKKINTADKKKIEKHFGEEIANAFIDNSQKAKGIDIELVEDRIYLNNSI